MAKFLVRVELHSASWDDYETLHAEMAYRGFSTEVTGDNGRTYQLPTAEYVIHTDSGLEAVRMLAGNAARATGRKFGVIVAEYSRSAWVGSRSHKRSTQIALKQREVSTHEWPRIKFHRDGHSPVGWGNRSIKRSQV